jgi:hypothetical protein
VPSEWEVKRLDIAVGLAVILARRRAESRKAAFKCRFRSFSSSMAKAYGMGASRCGAFTGKK